MILVRAVGQSPAAPTTNTILPLSRGSALAAAGVLAALNAQANQIISDLTWQRPVDAILSLGGISAIMWAAMFTAWKIGGEDKCVLRRGTDVAMLCVVVVLSFVPVSYAAQAGLLTCACYLLATADRLEHAQRRSALVLLSLTGPLIWGRLILHLFERPILGLDALLVGSAIGSHVDGNMVRFADGSGRFIVGGPCSSVHNMSLAIVLWTTAAMLFRIRIDHRYVLIGLAMAGLMFALNVVRLSMLGIFSAHFDYLHDGGGAALFGLAGLIGSALLAGLGVIHATAKQH